ncbi:unnamed protein product [Polarella glacialis]|uniref:CDAN1-interacting nuclease 1 n=1 Tax=Polarella glacialis TaxID=89957 RepID=A0A813DE95_POLGL|nr:unnamed protein product [Polarella glacialis]
MAELVAGQRVTVHVAFGAWAGSQIGTVLAVGKNHLTVRHDAGGFVDRIKWSSISKGQHTVELLSTFRDGLPVSSQIAAPSSTDYSDVNWSRYYGELGLEDAPREDAIALPISTAPVLSTSISAVVKQWAKDCFHVYINGTNLIDMGAIRLSRLEAFAGWDPTKEDTCGGMILRAAVQHLREQVDVLNKACIGKCPKMQHRGMALFCKDKKLRKLSREIEQILGISGFSYGQLFAESLLGSGGAAEFKDALRKVRCATGTPAEVQAMSFSACSEILQRGGKALAKLTYLARHNIIIDLGGQLAGKVAEELLEGELLKSGMRQAEYITEQQLRDIQVRLFGKVMFPTPDVVFRRPCIVQHAQSATTSPRSVRWIDVKDSIVVPGCTMQVRCKKFQLQMQKYVDHFGEGAVIWRHGWVESLQVPKSVSLWRFCDGVDKCLPGQPVKKRRKLALRCGAASPKRRKRLE